jgi:hypothetical protein
MTDVKSRSSNLIVIGLRIANSLAEAIAQCVYSPGRVLQTYSVNVYTKGVAIDFSQSVVCG